VGVTKSCKLLFTSKVICRGRSFRAGHFIDGYEVYQIVLNLGALGVCKPPVAKLGVISRLMQGHALRYTKKVHIFERWLVLREFEGQVNLWA
jgi:hypothetical protein